MDRSSWLKEKRRRTEERMDTLWAPTYDQNWGGYINDSHRLMIDRFLAVCPPGGIILDAACGTGKYWPIILAAGRSIYGIDQSQQMLNRATSKHPNVPVEKLGLQEMQFVEAFDGIICYGCDGVGVSRRLAVGLAELPSSAQAARPSLLHRRAS